MPNPTPPQFTRTTDCLDAYANNVQFEPSVWDLKIVFGKLNQHGGDAVEQHATVTIPWKVAKLFCYCLQLQVFVHEFDNGRLTLPPALWPPEPVLGEALKDDPRAQEAWRFVTELHEALITDLAKAPDRTTPKPTGGGLLSFAVPVKKNRMSS